MCTGADKLKTGILRTIKAEDGAEEVEPAAPRNKDERNDEESG